jgi:hypothetical protein
MLRVGPAQNRRGTVEAVIRHPKRAQFFALPITRRTMILSLQRPSSLSYRPNQPIERGFVIPSPAICANGI